MISSEFQIQSINIEDFKLTLLIRWTLLSARGKVKIVNLLLGMCYMPKMLSSEFVSPSIKIEDLKIKLSSPIDTKEGGLKITKLLRGMSSNMP